MQISISKRKAKCIRFHFECVPPSPFPPSSPSSFIQRGTVNRVRLEIHILLSRSVPEKIRGYWRRVMENKQVGGIQSDIYTCNNNSDFFYLHFIFIYFFISHKVFWNFAQLYIRIMLRYAVITVIIGLWLLWRKFIKEGEKRIASLI